MSHQAFFSALMRFVCVGAILDAHGRTDGRTFCARAVRDSPASSAREMRAVARGALCLFTRTRKRNHGRPAADPQMYLPQIYLGCPYTTETSFLVCLNSLSHTRVFSRSSVVALSLFGPVYVERSGTIDPHTAAILMAGKQVGLRSLPHNLLRCRVC